MFYFCLLGVVTVPTPHNAAPPQECVKLYNANT